MKVLLVGGAALEQQALSRALGAAQHQVEVARDLRACQVFRDREHFDAYVVDWASAGPSAPDLVRQIREHEQDCYTFVVAILATSTALTVSAAFEAGVDDVARRPIVPEEVVGRLRTLDRIRRWATRVAVPNSGVVRDFSGSASLTGLRAWMEADLPIALDMQGALGRDLACRSAGVAVQAGRAAEISLTHAGSGSDVCLRVSIDSASLLLLGQLVFGGVPDDAALADMVRELANTAGGAFKRVAEAEGTVLTTGLPRDANPTSVPSDSRTSRAFWIQVVGTAAVIQCDLVIRGRTLERLNPARLAEGMVLARDLFSPQGALLLPVGTRLTDATVAKLARLLAPTAIVEIARAA